MHPLLPLFLLQITLLPPCRPSTPSARVEHGSVYCEDSSCYLECDGGWVNNGTYSANNTDLEFECVKPATLVVAGYSNKPPDGGSGRIDSVELYKSSSFSSTPPSSLPLTRSYHTATTVGDAVYVVGGQINDLDENGEIIRGVYTPTCLKYTPQADAWTPIGNLSFARWWHSAAPWRNYVYVLGGRHGDEGTVINTVERYDVEKEAWSHGPIGTTPHPVYGHCSVTLRNRIYVVGGVNEGGYWATMHSLDPKDSTWRMDGVMQHARVHHACAVYGGGVLVAGGSYSGEYLASAELWTEGELGFRAAGRLKVAREYHSMSVHMDTAVVFGGFYIEGFTNHYLDSLEMYNVTSGDWELAEQHLEKARRRFAVAQLPERLFWV